MKYMAVHVLSFSALFGLLLGGGWSFSTPILAFVVIPIIELFWQGSTENIPEDIEQQKKNEKLYDILLYFMVPMQYGMLCLFLTMLSSGKYPTLLGKVGATWTMGICCGVLGINVAHELGHRRKWWERLMAKSLLLSSMYMHFFIEHNRGHHVKVATDDDPASARKNEPLYGFWFRSVMDGYLSAWQLEKVRLQKKGISWFHFQNEMLQFQLIQVGLLVGIGFFFGTMGVVGFVASAFIGFLLLETVNYIEHYGLQRSPREDGYFERVRPSHSWNSNHSLGRLILFELTRHSDHHASPTRKYQLLRHFDESPQLPTGYPGMMLLACVPPLWFKVMNDRIAIYHKKSES